MPCILNSISDIQLAVTAKIILQSGLFRVSNVVLSYNMQLEKADPQNTSPHQVLNCYFNWSRKNLLSARYVNMCL